MVHGNAWECLGLLALQDPTRVFYESLLDEKPDGPIAIKCACKISRDSQERQVSGAKCQTLVSRSLCFAFHQVPERLLGRYCVEHGTLTPELHKPTVKKYVSLLKKAWADKILCTSNGDMSWMGASSQMSSTGGTLRVTWALCLLQTHCQIAFSLPLR